MKKTCSIHNEEYESGSFSDRVHGVLEANQEELNQKLREMFGLEQIPAFRSLIQRELYNYRDGLLQELEEHFEYFLVHENNPLSKEEYKLWEKRIKGIIQFVVENLKDQNQFQISIAKIWYSTLIRAQKHLNQWINKENALLQLALHKYYANEPNAPEYLKLTYIENILLTKYRNRPQARAEIKTAYFLLTSQFGLKRQLEKIHSSVNEFVERYSVEFNQFDVNQIVNPEEILTWIYTSKILSQTQVEIFDFDPDLARAKFDLLKSRVEKKGWLLEQFIAYLFLSQSFFKVNSNIRGKRSETDLRLTNSIKNDILFYLLGEYVLVESKNWDKHKVTVTETHKFISNISMSKCTSGILFAMKGITGDRNFTGSRYAIHKAFANSGIAVIVVGEEDIKRLLDEESTINDLILEKFENLKFDEY